MEIWTTQAAPVDLTKNFLAKERGLPVSDEFHFTDHLTKFPK
jgi:hypothetical protein